MAKRPFLPASFDGILFPVSSITAVGALRHALHEYPHTPGGDPEKLGRKSYVIRMACIFADIDGPIREKYPDLYPNGLKNLRATLDEGKTADLVIPTIGKIKAFGTGWNQQWSAKNLSGEDLEVEWLEDQTSDFLISDPAFEIGANDVVAKAKVVRFLVSQEDFEPSVMDLFDALSNTVGEFQRARDQVGRQIAAIESKVRKVETACKTLKALANPLKQAEFVRLTSAVSDVQYAAVVTAQALAAPILTVLTYVVSWTMSVTELAIQIYKDASRAVDILKMNEFADALRIPAGTKVKYPKPNQ